MREGNGGGGVIHILIVVMNCQLLHSFGTSITSEWRKMIECPRAAWVFNKLTQRRNERKGR